MIKDHFKKAEAEKMIREFSTSFFNRFGINPIVVYEVDKDMREALTLEDIEEAANANLKRMWHKGHPFPTVRTRGRIREIVTNRQLYCYYARKEGYGLHVIGHRIGYDHATVLHACRNIENLVKSKDKLLLLEVEKMEELLALKQYNFSQNGKNGSTDDGDVQQDNGSGTESKPVLSPLLFISKCIKPKH